jgi:transposase
MKTRNDFQLKEKDREFLSNLTKAGKHNAREFERAYVLLALDSGKLHQEISDFLNVSRISIWRVKHKCLKEGVKVAIKDEPRPGQPQKYKDVDKAELIATACSKAPEGRSRWTLRLLEDTMKKKGVMITRESIRLVLKKTNVSLG